MRETMRNLQRQWREEARLHRPTLFQGAGEAEWKVQRARRRVVTERRRWRVRRTGQQIVEVDTQVVVVRERRTTQQEQVWVRQPPDQARRCTSSASRIASPER